MPLIWPCLVDYKPSIVAGGEEEAKPFLGRYQLQKKIAVGGMAELYLAQVSGVGGFQKQVVVKRILPQLAESEELFRMFLDEARIAATLDHPNVVQVYDSCEENGEYFMAMEYLEGTDLRTLRKVLADRESALPWEHVLHIIGNICAGLHYAHEKCDFDGDPLGIVHRDVTPHNIFLTRDGGIKLVDFGIAKAQGRMTETAIGMLKGKLAYMSPEQCRGEAIDRRSDIYSLGIILYELTTGGRLYSSATEYELINEIVDGDIKKPSEFMEYPSSLETIVLRCLGKDRADRYENAQEVQAELEKFAQEHRLMLSALSFASFLKPLLSEATKVAEERWQHRQEAAPLRMAGAKTQGLSPRPTPPRRSPSIVAEMRQSPDTTRTDGTKPKEQTDGIPDAIVDPSSALSALLRNEEFDNDELTARVPSDMLEKLRSEEREQAEQERDERGVVRAVSPNVSISSNVVRRESPMIETDEKRAPSSRAGEPSTPVPPEKDAVPLVVAGGRSGTVLVDPLDEASVDFQIAKPGTPWIWLVGAILAAGAIVFLLTRSPDKSAPTTRPKQPAIDKGFGKTLTITTTGKAKIWLLLGRTPIHHSLETSTMSTGQSNPQIRVEHDGYVAKEVILGIGAWSRDPSGQTYYDDMVQLQALGQEELPLDEKGSDSADGGLAPGDNPVIPSSGDAPTILRITSIPAAAKTWLFIGESAPKLKLNNIAVGSDVHLRLEVPNTPPVFRSVLKSEFDGNGRAAISVTVSNGNAASKDAGSESTEAGNDDSRKQNRSVNSEDQDSDPPKKKRRRRKPSVPLSPTPDWAR